MVRTVLRQRYLCSVWTVNGRAGISTPNVLCTRTFKWAGARWTWIRSWLWGFWCGRRRNVRNACTFFHAELKTVSQCHTPSNTEPVNPIWRAANGYCPPSQIVPGATPEQLEFLVPLPRPYPPPRRLGVALLMAQHPEYVIHVVAHQLCAAVRDHTRCA